MVGLRLPVELVAEGGRVRDGDTEGETMLWDASGFGVAWLGLAWLGVVVLW